MKSEKDEVSLVVEGGNLPAHKLRVLWEESGEESADGVAQARAEVVQDHLGTVFSGILASPLH